MIDYMTSLRNGFGDHVSMVEKRPGIMKLIAPLFHEDGDMVDIFLEENGRGDVRVSDHGLTLMRLSYTFDIDTSNKERIFSQIIGESNVNCDEGNLYIDVPIDRLYPAVLHFGQVVAKVSSMSLYKRSIISDLFYEMVNEFISEKLAGFQPQEAAHPLPSREELEVDYRFDFGRVPIFAFAAKERESSKIKLVAISCLEFERNKIPFRSIVVHQDFNALPKKDRSIITSAADKQFISLDDFREHGASALERLAA